MEIIDNSALTPRYLPDDQVNMEGWHPACGKRHGGGHLPGGRPGARSLSKNGRQRRLADPYSGQGANRKRLQQHGAAHGQSPPDRQGQL